MKRFLKYLAALFTFKFEEKANPKIQLEQALAEAKAQDYKLKDSAATIVGNQRQIEMKLARKEADIKEYKTKTMQAIQLAEDAEKSGDTVKARGMSEAAESFTTQLVTAEAEVASLMELHKRASEASDRAKQAVEDNSRALQKKIAEKVELMSMHDQNQMDEQINKTMTSLGESVSADAPSFDGVREKIEARQAKLRGQAEINSSTVDSHMIEVERASRDLTTSSRLAQIKAEMGMGEISEGETKQAQQ